MSALSLSLDTDDLAQHYETVSADRQFKSGCRLVEALAIGAGDRVLDIGCGTGLLARHVAGVVGPTGSVAGIDPLPLRIELAKRKAGANLSFQVGNAYDLTGFEPEGFDVVYLNAVFHWLPEKTEPLRAIHRVLKSGGRLGISTGSKDFPNRVHEIGKRVLLQEPYSRFPEARIGTPHRVTLDELRALLEGAGFAVERIELAQHAHYHPTADAAIRFSEASSFGNYLGHLPAELQARARDEIVDALEELRTPKGIRQAGARIVAVGIK